MQVVILAAGQSKRLQPVRDKNLINFLGKSLILRQIEALRKAGVLDIFVVCGDHNTQEIQNELKNIKDLTFTIQKDLSEGMAGAVLSAEDQLNDDPLLVVSANDVVDPDAYKLIFDSHLKLRGSSSQPDTNFDSLILAKKVDKYFPGGYLELDHEFNIKRIIEKPGEGKEPSNLVNIVLHLHKNPKQLIEFLKKTKSSKDDRYEMALNNMIKNGLKIKAIAYNGFWQPIKYPWHILNIWKYFFAKSNKYIKSKDISSKAIIKGDVIIEEGVKIFEGAIVNGPCYIGKNAIIANNALVRDSHIGEGSVIGFSSEISGSFLASNVWTHTNYIGDSIIGNNCSFGSGTITGNLRLDEQNISMMIEDEKIDTGLKKFGVVMGDNIRVGIHCSFMPGIKVFSNSMIIGGFTVSKDIPFNSFVKCKTEIEITSNRITLDKNTRNAFKKIL